MTRASVPSTAGLFLLTALLSSAALAQEEGEGFDFGDEAPTDTATDTPVDPEEAPPAEPSSDPTTDSGTTDGIDGIDGGETGGSATDSAENAGAESALDEGINLTLQDRIKAVSRKVFLKDGRFELQPALAVTMNDPFFRTWQVAGRFAYHLNDAFALELGGSYVPPFFVEKLPPLDLLRQRARLVNVDSTLLGLADVGVTFSPIYGKLAILSDAIIHFDAFASAGVGTVFDSNFKEADPLHFVHPTMDIGVGLRVFMLRWLVVRADLRDYVYPQDRASISTLQNLLIFSLGVGFYFPFDFEYRYEAARVKS